MFKNSLKTILFLLIFGFVNAQQPSKPNAVELYHKIEKLNFLGSVLYIAAHPDDENTKLISYLLNEKNARTAYLSLTRGDGGQNLIGPELREQLGVIRTQELIEARKIDGGEQFFSRANDFGFSKNPDETLQIWDKNQVLNDVVWIIRNFKPDVIINRFDHRSPGTTHGHHTSSAMLSVEAFDKVNDPMVFPDQLNLTSIWQPKRLFFNTSWWFYGSKEKFDQADKTNLLKIETGVFYEQFGKSNQEIAALSRSRHQSQGFGTTGTRGEEQEYLEFLKGTSLQDKSNIFEGIDTSWNRIKNGKAIGEILSGVQQNFNFKNPQSSVSELVKAYKLINQLDDNEHWKKIKLEEIKKIIAGCSGLYLEATTDSQEFTPNSELKFKIECINRSSIPMKLIGISSTPLYNSKTEKNIELKNNIIFIESNTLQLPNDFEYTNPYWLNKKGTTGMYVVENQQNIGQPDVQRQAKVGFWIQINGTEIPFEKNIVYKYNDDVKGEVYQPLDIVPIVTSTIQEKVYIFPNTKSKIVTVKIKTAKENISGSIRLQIPKNWGVYPTSIPFTVKNKGEEFSVDFNVTPSKDSSEILLKSIVTVDGQDYDKDKIDINYSHIYKQIIIKSSEAKAIRLDIKIKNEKIAYIMGAGDEVPKSLKQMGYEVSILKPDEITTKKLNTFDVIMTGIRAYNVINSLAFKQNLLFDFVKNGKTMIVQYNTLDEFVTKDIAPYSIKISRDRVTDENSEIRFLAPENSILNYPNKITNTDFEGWKQERGLYYPSEWAKEFTAVISSNDKDETAKNGGILVAKYGEGHYIYTGLSFFRELPEGVSGAFRLMANLISVK